MLGLFVFFHAVCEHRAAQNNYFVALRCERSVGGSSRQDSVALEGTAVFHWL